MTVSIQEIAENKAREAEKLKTEISDSNSEKSLLEKIGDGIWDGAGQAVEDTIDGIVALGKWETWENMGYAVTHLDETLPAMWHVLSESFKQDIINGDAESRARWGTYALSQIGLGLIGDKGVSKISKVTTLAKGANISKFSQGMSQVANKLNMGDRLAFADASELNIRSSFGSTAFNQAEDTMVFAKPGEGTKVTSEVSNSSENLSRIEYLRNKYGYKFTYGAGSHAEVYSLNQALLTNPNAQPTDFITHVVRSGKKLKPAGMMMPTCPHCNFITEGFEFSSEVKKVGR